jgi:hypothetical protein
MDWDLDSDTPFSGSLLAPNWKTVDIPGWRLDSLWAHDYMSWELE